MNLNGDMSEFERRPLILAKCSSQGWTWISTRDCVWKGPKTLRSKIALNNIYPECQSLFFKVLGLKDTSFCTVVEDLYSLLGDVSTEDVVGQVKSLLLDLSAFNRFSLKDECKTSGLLESAPLAFLPIYQPTTGMTDLQPLNGDFYIADEQHFVEIFKPCVPLLDFPLDEIRRLQGLLEALALKKRFLSSAHRSKCMVKAGPFVDISLTNEIRSKASDLYRYVQCSWQIIAHYGTTFYNESA